MDNSRGESNAMSNSRGSLSRTSPPSPAGTGGDWSKSMKRIEQLFAQGVQVVEWNPRNVGDWLEVIGYPQYRKHFISRGVDGNVLLKLNPGILQSLGVRNMSHQHRIMDDIAKLKDMSWRQEEASQDIPAPTPMKTKVVGLVKKQEELASRAKCFKELRDELNDLAKRGVFAKLTKYSEALKLEGGADLVSQAYDNICQLKAKLSQCEKEILDTKANLNVEMAKAAGQLGCSDTDLLKGLSTNASMPTLPSKRNLKQEDLDSLVKRLHPDPEDIKAEKKKAAEAAKQAWLQRRVLTSEELSEQFSRLYPDPEAQRQKWKAREDEQDNEVRVMVSRGTENLAPEERSKLIEEFNERWKADMLKRGLI